MERLHLGESGWLEYDHITGEEVRLGDRLLVRHLQAVFPPGSGFPGLTMRLEVVDGVPQCRELHLVAPEGQREIRTSDLRAIPLADWVEMFFGLTAVLITRESQNGAIHGMVALDDATVRQTERLVQQARSAGRRKINDEFLEEVATIYRANIDSRPTEAVRLAMAVKYRTAAMYVEKARARGFLPATTPGQRKA